MLTQGTCYFHERTGFITFKTQVQRTDAIAVAYRIENTNLSDPSDDLFFGELERNINIEDSVLLLKLIKPGNLQPQNKIAWYYRAVGFQGSQNLDSAMAMYRKVLAIDPKFKPAKNNLAQLKKIQDQKAGK